MFFLHVTVMRDIRHRKQLDGYSLFLRLISTKEGCFSVLQICEGLEHSLYSIRLRGDYVIAEAKKWPELSCPYYKNESLFLFMPSKAKAAWAHRAIVNGPQRVLGLRY